VIDKIKQLIRLPESSNKNIALFYFLTLVNNSWFIAGNWIFFWTRFMTYGRLGVVDALAFAFGLIMEVPTGAVSDLIGRKKTILASCILGFTGIMLIASASGTLPIFIGFLITQAGWAFYSGSAEAMAYDSLKEKKQDNQYDKVISASNVIGIVATVVTTLLGAVMYKYNFRLPHYAWGFAYLFGFVASFWIEEPSIDTMKFSFRNYFNQMGEGAKQLLTPNLRPYIPIMFAILGIYYLYSYGLVRPAIAIHFGFFATEQAVIGAILGITCAIAVGLIPKMRDKLSDVAGLVLLTGVLAVGFLFAAMPLGYYGFLVMLAIALSGNLASPWVSIVVNRELPSKYRATALSTIALFTKIPYVVAAMIAGRMIDSGYLWLFNLVIGVLVVITVIWTLFSFSTKKNFSRDTL